MELFASIYFTTYGPISFYNEPKSFFINFLVGALAFLKEI